MSHEADLLNTLESITGTGKFVTSGVTPFFLPSILVHDEELAFPIPPSQVHYLISLAENAPYGHGEETVLDENVRESWQIDASQIHFPSKGKWPSFLNRINALIVEKLGVRSPFIAQPCKLLIYGNGGHFKPHTDTEKIPGMFGTLIIAMPSRHEGGELIVRHAGKKKPFPSTLKKTFTHSSTPRYSRTANTK